MAKYVFKSDYEANVFQEEKKPFDHNFVIDKAALVGINILKMTRKGGFLLIETEIEMTEQQKTQAQNFLKQFDINKTMRAEFNG